LASVFILDVAVAGVAVADMLLLGCFMLLVGDEAEEEDCIPVYQFFKPFKQNGSVDCPN